MSSNALVLSTQDEVFAFAERICRANLLPAAYRGKAPDTAIAILYGAELGLSPMSSLQRVIVIDGKPTLDGMGITAVIRQAGHKLEIVVSDDKRCVISYERADTGEKGSVEYTIEEGQRAGLLGKDNWRKFPSDMLFNRCVSRMGRRGFSDLLMGFGYVPEELEEVGATAPPELHPTPEPVPEAATVRREPPAPHVAPEVVEVDATGEPIADAEVVEVDVLAEAGGDGVDVPEPEAAPEPTVTQRQVNAMRKEFAARGMNEDADHVTFVNTLLSINVTKLKDMTVSEFERFQREA